MEDKKTGPTHTPTVTTYRQTDSPYIHAHTKRGAREREGERERAERDEKRRETKDKWPRVE